LSPVVILLKDYLIWEQGVVLLKVGSPRPVPVLLVS